MDSAVAVLLFMLVQFLAGALAPYLAWINPELALRLGVLSGLGYFLLADALPGGQSIGKRLAGIYVMDRKTGAGCGVYQSFIRNAGALLIIDWIWILFEARTRLGDMQASTVVLQTDRLQGRVRSLADIYDGGRVAVEPPRESVAVTTMLDELQKSEQGTGR